MCPGSFCHLWIRYFQDVGRYLLETGDLSGVVIARKETNAGKKRKQSGAHHSLLNSHGECGLLLRLMPNSCCREPALFLKAGGEDPRGAFFSAVFIVCAVCSATQSCLTLCVPMDCSPPGSSGREIL